MTEAILEVESDSETLPQLLARAAKEWLTFERLRQELKNLEATDPAADRAVLLLGTRDVKEIVLELLSERRPYAEVERTRYALIRSLATHPDIVRHCFEAQFDESQVAQDPGALQAMLQAREDIFAHWEDFLDGMQRVGAQVCQICIDGKFFGSGFLISDRHVLTAYHVVSSLANLFVNESDQEAVHTQLSVVFDDIVVPGKPTGPFRSEFGVAKKWLTFNSKQDDREFGAESPLDELQQGRLDFAVICLDQPAGRTAPKRRSSLRRDWIDLEALANPPGQAAQMLIAHFPAGADLRLSVGLFDRHSQCASRVRYRVPTVIGSSGAPCFTVDWKPYAIHNAGYKKVYLNQGVPLAKIVEAIGGLDSLKKAQVVETDPLPAVTPKGEPILGRRDIVEHVDKILRRQSPEAALVVNSAEQGGKTYTAELIRSIIIDRGHAAFLFDVELFANDEPHAFASRLVSEIAGSDELPPPSPDNRQRARWISKSLSDWTRSRISKEGPTPPSTNKTLWVILDRCDRVKLTQETHDLLIALIAGDDGQESDETLRFLLLGYGGDMATVPAKRVWKTRLDLVSGPGVLPFMQSVLTSLSVIEEPGETTKNAAAWVQAATDLGITQIPRIVEGLKAWETKRRKSLAVQ